MTHPTADLLARLIVAHVCDGIVLTDADGRTVWVNPAFTAMSGYTLDDLVGKRPGTVLQGEQTSLESKAALAEAIRARTTCKVDILNYTKDGKTYTSEVKLSPIFDESNVVTHFVAVQRDVSHERALRQESIDFKAYQRALEQQAIVSVTDARGRITYVNGKFSKISGYTAEELIGQTHRIVNSGHHDRVFFKDMWSCIRQGDTWHGEVCNRAKDGSIYWVDTTVVPVHSASGQILRYVSIRYEITATKLAEQELTRLAETDGLTGVANRMRFAMDLDEMLAAVETGKAETGGLLLVLDIDHFKSLNDSMGHPIGDALLRETAKRLVAGVGEGGIVARLGGDEFAAIIPSTVAGDRIAFVQRLHHQLCQPIGLESFVYMPSYSMGVTRYPEDSLSSNKLMTHADVALYDAKRSGRNTWRFFDTAAVQRNDKRGEIRDILTKALEDDQVEIAMQPICQAKTRAHTGFEVLARLQHKGRAISPDQFIPVAEDSGLIPALGRRVMERAFDAALSMKQRGLSPGTISVNVAPNQFREPGFVANVMNLLKQYNIPPTELVLEITETTLIGRSTEQVSQTLREFVGAGVQIALDDFGTGFSSLSHLRDFVVQRIKIDKTFISGLPNSRNDLALVSGLAALARSLNLEVVAEGVETEEQFDILSEIGCHYIQGYHNARPLSVREAVEFLAFKEELTGRSDEAQRRARLG